MTTDIPAPAGAASYTFDGATFRHKPALFRMRHGRAKRVLRLAKQDGVAAAIRGGVSLLYARLRVDSRVGRLRDWSDAAVDAWAGRMEAGAAPAGAEAPRREPGTPVTSQDMRQLVGRLTRGCARTVQPDVFDMIVKRYCRRADLARLVALRGVLGDGAWARDAAPDDPARMAWQILSATVDGELARRALAQPLQQLAQVLAHDASPQAVDNACVRLAVALGRSAGDRPGHGVLVAALADLTHPELRTLAAHLTPGSAAGKGPDSQRRRASCPMAAMLRPLHRSPDLLQRRLDLIAALQAAVREAVDDQLGYFVPATSQLIEFQRGRGRCGQAVHDLAAASLKKSLDTLRYPAFPGRPAGDELVSRILLCALARKKPEGLRDFLAELKAETLVTLMRAAEGTADFDPLLQAMRRARDDRMAPHRAMATRHLRALKDCAARGDRWSAARELNDLALSLRVWDRKCEQFGVAIPDDLRHELDETIVDVTSRLFRGPGNATGPLDAGSLSVLCHREIECLRDSEARLADHGLRLEARALEDVARQRSQPHIAMGVEHAVAMLDMLAETPPVPDRIVTALCDCVEALNIACVKQASFKEIGVDDIAHLSVDILQQAWNRFVERRPGQVTAARKAIGQFGPLLANGLLDAATCLVDDLDDEVLTDDERRQLPASHAVRLLRLASQLMEAAQSASVPVDQETPPYAGGDGLAAAWTPALRNAVAEQFGVNYDAAAGKADVAMTLAQHQEFARELLRDEMTAKETVRREIATPAGTAFVEMDGQLVLDAIDRPSAQFSVSGVDREGRYMPYTSSAPVPGEDTHVPGVDRALLALQDLAGPDTAALTSYMSQSIGADFLRGMFALAPHSPVTMADGRGVLLSGYGATRTDLTRLADGAYVLRLGLVWDPLSTVMAYDGPDVRGVKLDARQSRASVSCEVRLQPTAGGGWHREVTRPLMVRYHLAPLEQDETA